MMKHYEEVRENPYEGNIHGNQDDACAVCGNDPCTCRLEPMDAAEFRQRIFDQAFVRSATTWDERNEEEEAWEREQTEEHARELARQPEHD
jgi:hypothetical protein